MICVSKQTVRLAFNAFCKRRVGWVDTIALQLEMYEAASGAFRGNGNLAGFGTVYAGLKKWKVGRAGTLLSPETILDRYRNLSLELRTKRLSSLTPADWPLVWDALRQLKDIKQTKKGEPRVMAVSKFLHFWNPRLFVICDQQEVEGFVFGHHWLRAQLESMAVARHVGETVVARESGLGQYLKLMALASEFVRSNPGILPEFARTVRTFARGAAVPPDIETYEATAVEWCLIGLAEMPPEGVSLT